MMTAAGVWCIVAQLCLLNLFISGVIHHGGLCG